MSASDNLTPAIIGAGSGLISAKLGSSAAKDAAAAQMATTMYGILESQRQYDQTRADYAPWREAGSNALAALESKIAAGPGEFTKSPGYEARLAEGQKALERSAAARGSVLSGAALKGLERFSQDYASNEYNNFLNQYYQSLTPFQSLAGVGLTATSGTAEANQQSSNVMQQLLQNYGNAAAAGYINQANAVTGGIQSGLNNALAGYNAWKSFQTPQSAASSTPAAYSMPVEATTYQVEPSYGFSGTMIA